MYSKETEIAVKSEEKKFDERSTKVPNEKKGSQRIKMNIVEGFLLNSQGTILPFYF